MPGKKKDLFEEMEEESKVDYTAPVEGGSKISIYLNKQLVEEITPSQLVQWCKENSFPFTVAEGLVGKHWLNHNGYSFV